MPTHRIAAVITCAVSAVALAGAQQPTTPPGRTPATFESFSTAVLVDVVVRDSKGRPLTDLTAQEFEIREDGVAQTLGSFTRVSRGDGIGINVALKEPGNISVIGPPLPPDDGTAEIEDRHPSVTALVFDALSAEAVSFCQRAALAELPMQVKPNARFGVFATSPAIVPLQGYTDDPTLVRQAVRRVMATSSSTKPDAESLQALRDQREILDRQAQVAVQQQATGGGAGLGGGNAANIGQLEIERRRAISQLRTLQSFDTLDREQRGASTTSALFTVLQSLVEMPGRKTLILFSEGLPASPALQANLQAVVEVANRANITVYAIDASGLRAVSGTLETRREIEEASKERLRQLDAPSDATDQPIMRLLERNEDLLRLDSQTGLARLAKDTGGFLVSETNNLRGALRRIDEDTRFHYLLTYAPSNNNFDGRFRAIDVKVKRPGVQVFARNGYRALRKPVAPTVVGYETSALAALDAERLANAFPFSSVVMNFPERLRPGLSPLVVRIKTDVLTYEERPDEGTYHAEAVVVARYRDAGGQVVHKASQQYHLTGRLDELKAARTGEILFYREPTLAPGTYTVEVAIMDGLGRASTRVATLDVPRAGPDDLRISSLVLIGKAERVTEGQDPANPLFAGDVLFYPSGGESFSRAGDRQLSVFYTIYPGTGFSAAPEATLEIQRQGRVIASVPVTLGARDGQGRIQQVSRIPLAPLSPGTYELRMNVRDGKATLARSAFFQVRE